MIGEFEFSDDRLTGQFDLRVFRLVAIQKTAYRFADRCTASLGSPVDELIRVTLVPTSKLTDAAATQLGTSFLQELLDQELREQLGEETRSIRTLILAQAFSKADLLRDE